MEGVSFLAFLLADLDMSLTFPPFSPAPPSPLSPADAG